MMPAIDVRPIVTLYAKRGPGFTPDSLLIAPSWAVRLHPGGVAGCRPIRSKFDPQSAVRGFDVVCRELLMLGIEDDAQETGVAADPDLGDAVFVDIQGFPPHGGCGAGDVDQQARRLFELGHLEIGDRAAGLDVDERLAADDTFHDRWGD